MIAGSMANATTPDHIAADNGAVASATAIATAAALPSLPANTNAKMVLLLALMPLPPFLLFPLYH
jgi:hypothetical protein